MDIIASHQAGLLEELRAESVALAAGIGDFAQRAATYHHLYQHSGGNHAFPLLAAHGALWGAQHFRAGLRLGGLLKWRFGRGRRAQMVDALERFTVAMRDINRQVCVETYYCYRLSASAALRDEAVRHIEPALLEGLDRAHAHRRAGTVAPVEERRALFELFYDWEQRTVVELQLKAAYDAFDWPELSRMARRPAIRFSYLRHRPLRFRDFTDQGERRVKGLAAFDRAERRGWKRVEQDLATYRALPAAFATNPAQAFYALQRQLAERRRKVDLSGDMFRPDEAVRLAA